MFFFQWLCRLLRNEQISLASAQQIVDSSEEGVEDVRVVFTIRISPATDQEPEAEACTGEVILTNFTNLYPEHFAPPQWKFEENCPGIITLPNVLRLCDVSVHSSKKKSGKFNYQVIYIGPKVPHNFPYYKNTTEMLR